MENQERTEREPITDTRYFATRLLWGVVWFALGLVVGYLVSR